MAPEPIQEAELLGETRNLKRLARGLLFDRSQDEDVVQEAWLAALRRTPTEEWSLGAWLAGTVRRLAWNENRGDARTRRREEAAARAEALPSTVDSLTRIETLKGVVEAVGELDEPYRQTILLRFFDELPPREIAKREGVPVETVRTRTRRGLELLRRRLDDDAPARGTLLAALLPMAGKMPWPIALGLPAGSTSLVSLTGTLVMSKTIQLAVAAIAVVLLSTAGYRVLSSDPQRAASPSEGVVLAPVAPAADEASEDRGAEELSAAEERRNVIDLGPGAEGDWIVRGHLTLGIDDPYPGARVRIEVYEGWIDADAPEAPPTEVALATADESGEFACALPTPTGPVTVLARPDLAGHFQTRDWHSVGKGMQPPQTLNPRAYPIDSTLRGRVVDTDGNALAGARVTTYRSEGETDEEGGFALPASSVESTIRGKVLLDGFAEGKLAVRPLEVGELDAGTITLQRGLRVSGRVVDEAGHPVEAAIVSSSWMGFGKRLDYETVTSAADGTFVLDQVDGETDYVSVSASKDGYVHSSVKLKDSPEDTPRTEIEIVLPVGGVVRGEVRFADGSPGEDVWLCVGFSPAGIPRVDAHADENGRFEFPNVPSGPQILWAVREGKRTVQLPIDVPAGGGVLDGLSLEIEDGHYLEGVVLDENNEPMPWVMVYAEGNRRDGESYVASYPKTDRNGRFRIDGLPGDFITLGFLEGGYSRHEEDFTEFDRDDLVIRMRPAGKLAGRVVDGRTGEPVESFTIRFVSAALGPGEESLSGYWAKWSRGGMTFTGTDGYWNADSEELEGDRWVGIEATAPGYGPSVATRVQTVGDPDPDGLVLRLFEGAVVHGTVVEASSGRPVAGAKIMRFTAAEPLREQRWQDEHPYWTETDAEGRFELEEVPAGTMSLAIEHEDWSLTLDGPFEVAEGGAVVERRVAVAEGLVVRGVVLDQGGTPLAGQHVELQALETAGEAYRTEKAVTSEDGSFRFKNALAGLYHLRWVDRRETFTCHRMTKLIEVEEGAKETPVVLQMEGKAKLFGSVTVTGEMPEQMTVVLSPRGDTGSRTTTEGRSWAGLTYSVVAEDGRFEVDGLKPGEYTVSAYHRDGGGMAHGSTQVEVPADGSIDVTIELKTRER